MKIALCGSNDTARADLVKAFISQWPMYATPIETIFDDIKWPENLGESLNDLKEKLNDVEQILFAKMLLLEKQYEQFATQGHIIYNGSGIDILINSLILCENGYVTEDFVERIIYHNKKLLRKIDVVYYIPNDNINEESSEAEKMLEMVYWNFYDNYQTDFKNSPFFDHDNCPSILILESKSPINEIKMLLDTNGNLEGTSSGGADGELLDMEKMKKVLRGNPQLLEAAMESLKSGNPQNIGTITI